MLQKPSSASPEAQRSTFCTPPFLPQPTRALSRNVGLPGLAVRVQPIAHLAQWLPSEALPLHQRHRWPLSPLPGPRPPKPRCPPRLCASAPHRPRWLQLRASFVVEGKPLPEPSTARPFFPGVRSVTSSSLPHHPGDSEREGRSDWQSWFSQLRGFLLPLALSHILKNPKLPLKPLSKCSAISTREKPGTEMGAGSLDIFPHTHCFALNIPEFKPVPSKKRICPRKRLPDSPPT